MADRPIRQSSFSSGFFQEVRTTLGAGGPGEIELIASCDENGAKIAIWNPFRHEWATLELQGQGDTRLPVAVSRELAQAKQE